MSTGPRIPLADAERLSAELLTLIDGEAHVVGSVRRRKPDVGDIEIALHVGASLARVSIAPGPLMPGDFEHVRGGGQEWRYLQIMHRATGYVVDLFRFDDANRGSIMIIRTGPAEHSKRFVTDLKRNGLRHEDGYVRDQGTIVPCPDERTAYALAGMRWLDPEDRT